MEGGFGGRQGEDQPAVAGVDGGEIEDVAEEGAVGFRVRGVEDDVGAGEHVGVPFGTIILSPCGGVRKELREAQLLTGLGVVESHLSQKAAKDGAPVIMALP